MIYSCPNCGAALVYEPGKQCLTCHSCDSIFRPEEIDTQYIPTMHMEFNIYSCTACGAEIMVNTTEAATYCVYCGQPVIVFDRVSSELQPDYIIPFEITPEFAQKVLEHRIKKKFFVPRKFKKYKIDMLRGIYIPFWLYDIDYHDKQYLLMKMKMLGGLTECEKGYCKEAETEFMDIPVNASRVLSDDELQELGRYDLTQKVAFNPGYLSGFYADRYDIAYEQAAGQALEKAEIIFDALMRNYWYDRNASVVNTMHKEPKAVIKKISYALFPVWFVTVRYKGQPYTLLVNGQTGGVAGNLPIKKAKAFMLFILLCIPVAPVFTLLAYFTYLAYIKEQLTLMVLIPVLSLYALIMWFGLLAIRFCKKEITKGLHFARSSRVQRYVKERQGI